MQINNSDARPSPAAPRLHVLRIGRLLVVVRVVLLAVLVIALVVAGLASLDNALTPAVQLAYVTDGPQALAAVHTLLLDPRSGALYAGTDAGLFKSTDDGRNWLPSGNGLPGVDILNLSANHRTGDLYAVVTGVGLFRSSDGAQSWTDITNGFRGSSLVSIGVDEQTGMLLVGLLGYGIYDSTDNGAHWYTVGMGLSNMNVRAIVTGPRPGEVFAATNTGVYHTTQVTGTWDLLTAASGSINAYALVRNPRTGTLYAGTSQGVLKLVPRPTAEQGTGHDTYLVSLTGLTGPQVQALALDEQAGVLYAGTTDGLYRSSDEAATWVHADQGLESTLVRALVLKPQSHEILAGTDSGVNFSTDGGASWQDATLNTFARHALALLVNQPDHTLYAGTLGGGVFRSSDGGASWQPISTGLRNTVVQALGIDRDTNTLFAGTRGGLYRTVATGASPNETIWQLVSPRMIGQDVIQIAVDERRGNVYAVTSFGDVFRSSNAGADWALVQPLQRVFARTVAVSYYSGAIYVGAYRGGVLMSLNGGYNWFPTPNLRGDRNIEALAVDERNGTLYAGSLSGSIYQFINRETGWQQLGNTLPSNIVALAVDEKTSALFAAVKEGLYRLDPASQVWQPSMTGMGHTDMLAITMNRTNGVIYAGVMAGGAYRSEDGGQTWQAMSNGLTDIDMRGVVADDANGTLWVSATGRGVFQYHSNTKTWHAVNVGLPDISGTRSLAGTGTGVLDVVTGLGVYRTSNPALGWQPQLWSLGPSLGLVVPINDYGFVGRLPGGDLLWASRGGGAAWASMASSLGLVNASIRQLSNGQGQLYAVWGAEVTRSDPGAGYGRVPLAWLFVRAWVWILLGRLNTSYPWWWAASVALLALIAVLWVFGRARLSHRYGVPFKVVIFNSERVSQVAKTGAVEHAWPHWERIIQTELYAFGDVRPADLPGIPGPFRQYAMRRFADKYGQHQGVEFSDKRLITRARAYIRQWVRAWQAMRADLRRDGLSWQNRARTDELAQALAAVLERRTLPPLDNESVRAYGMQVASGSDSRLPGLALLFVADNEALKQTALNIVRAFEQLGEPDATGLVISLGRPGRNVEVTGQVRNALTELGTPQHGRLRVCTYDEVLYVMSAADPISTLAELLRNGEAKRSAEPGEQK